MKKFISILLSTSMMLGSISSVQASNITDVSENTINDFAVATDVDTTSEYYNPKYSEYINTIKDLPEDERISKLVNAPSKYSYNERYATSSDISTYSLSPNSSGESSYNGVLPPSNISGFQNQGDSREDCSWAFAANAVFEAYLIKNQIGSYNSSSKPDLSEAHLLFSTANTVSEQLGYPRDAYEPGEFNMAVSYWLRNSLSGPVSESSMGYTLTDTSYTEAELNSKNKIGYMVTDTITLSSLSSNCTENDENNRIADIKALIKSYGGVYIRFPYNSSGFNSYYTAYFLNDYTGCIDNPVALVGWDDNYSTANFGTTKPSGDGAFVAVDSREIGTQKIHYYYLSYDMVKSFGPCSAIKDVTKRNKYTYTYENETRLRAAYDIGTSANSNGTTNAFAEKFTAEGVSGKIESITAISTYCPAPSSYYKVYIGSDKSNMAQVNTKETATSNGVFVGNIGYHTFELEEPQAITGDTFWVGIEVYNADENYTIPVCPTAIRGGEGCGVYAENMNSIKNNSSVTTTGDLILKAHVNRETPSKMFWNFSDDNFKNLGTITSTLLIDGLTIAASEDKYMTMETTGNNIYNVTYDYKLNLKGKGMGNYRKLSFDVDGPAEIFVMCKSSDTNSTRNLILADEAGVLDSVPITTPNCYKLTYSENSPSKLYVYSEYESMHIYAIGYKTFEAENAQSSDDNKEWLFDSEEFADYNSGENIISTISTADGLTVTASEKYPVQIYRSNNTVDGVRYTQALNLKGSGESGYRRVIFDVLGNMDIYITAAHSGGADEIRKLYVNDDFNMPAITEVDNSDAIDIDVTSQITTYKLTYNGRGDKLSIYSLHDGIKLYKISLVYNGDSNIEEDASYNSSVNVFSDNSINDITAEIRDTEDISATTSIDKNDDVDTVSDDNTVVDNTNTETDNSLVDTDISSDNNTNNFTTISFDDTSTNDLEEVNDDMDIPQLDCEDNQLDMDGYDLSDADI